MPARHDPADGGIQARTQSPLPLRIRIQVADPIPSRRAGLVNRIRSIAADIGIERIDAASNMTRCLARSVRDPWSVIVAVEPSPSDIAAVRATGAGIIALLGHCSADSVRQCMRSGATDCLHIARVLSDPTILADTIASFADTLVEERCENADAQALARRTDALLRENVHLTGINEAARQTVEDVAHDFQTPLTVIGEFASMISDTSMGPVTDEQKHALSVIRDAAADLSSMVGDVLETSRLRAGSMQVRRRAINPDALVVRVRTLADARAQRRRVRLRWSIEHGLPEVLVDQRKITRAVVNLVCNAIKFSRPGGLVSVSVGRSDDATGIVIAISDSGPGIEPEQQSRLFERYCRGPIHSRGGTDGFGLGLPIAAQMAAINFATIGIASERGTGTTFSLELPLADPASIIRRMLDRPGNAAELPPVAMLAVQPIRPAHAERLRLWIETHLEPCDLVLPTERGELIVIASAHRVRHLASLLRTHVNPDVDDDAAPPVPSSVRECGQWPWRQETAGAILHILSLDPSSRPVVRSSNSRAADSDSNAA